VANQSAVEQAILEMINRARLDPAGEAARFGIGLNEGVPAGNTISTTSKQPLAMNDQLLAAARGHSQSMIDNDYFAHDDPFTGTDPFDRMVQAGYNFSTAGENIAFRGTTGTLTQAMQLMLHQDLFVDEDYPGRGHRTNLLDSDFQEVGVGMATGVYTEGAQSYNAAMLTEDFATRSGAVTQFLTGVAFTDAVTADQFYTIGEGRANVAVTVTGGPATTAGSAGGYAAEVGAGVKTVTFSGGGLPAALVVNAVVAAGVNAKIDVMGTATIRTSVSLTTVSNVGTVIGLGTIGLTLTGADGAQTFVGTSGNDTIDGLAGVDSASGGLGNDNYRVDNAADQVFELANGGTDRVFASVSYALAAGQSIETLSTTNAAGTAAINLTGNALANVLVGNAGVNVLVGGGGGGDVLQGLGGNDTYSVQQGDTVLEVTGGGTDRVLTSTGYTLPTAAAVEVLAASNAGATTAMTLVGNGFANTLIGNAGANVLVGGGGGDILQGLGGNDSYSVRQGDTVLEAVGGGTDRVLTPTGYTLPASAEVEVLAASNAGATTAMTLVGNGFANTLIGNAGNNVLNGGGGHDILQSLAGADTFAFTSPAHGGDLIYDFSVDDLIAIDDAGFGFVKAGSTLAANGVAFVIGDAATSNAKTLFYSGSDLFWDPDGTGGSDPVLLATLHGHPALGASDFLVV
jgi:Ca2+-binding RTX toxin-like protein